VSAVRPLRTSLIAALSDWGVTPASASARAAAVQRRLNTELASNPGDVQRGLSRGSVLVGSLNSAAREAGPTSGEAVISVTINSQGELGDLVLVRGDAKDWSSVLRSFRSQAKQKRVRVPPGAAGLRVTFNVSTKLQRASGKEVDSSAVGVKTPSLKPNGLTFNGSFDLADLSGSVQRMVHARVISEEVL